MIPNGDVISFDISEDSNWVIYSAIQENENQIDLYKVSIYGSSTIKLNEPMNPECYVQSFKISPSGNYVVFKGIQGNSGSPNLYSSFTLTEDEIMWKFLLRK